MKLKELKKALDNLTPEQLEKELIYNSEDLSISGQVKAFKKAKANLYYTGEDDPAQLYTKNQLLEDGHDKEDIEGFDIEIHKGDFFIEL